MSAPPKKHSPKTLAGRIVRWFRAHQRDLPWRRTRDPYAIWISEIMLQQTQVQTVVPYFERWMRELPTARAFAEAPAERALKLWEGLGYYRRARHAQDAARRIIEKYGGKFPDTFEEVLALPGIGRYTAGAICSIAFNAPTPVLDGNVIRVLSRIYGVEGNPREKKTNARLWELAAELVAATNDCSALNQGLMELGAMVCSPRGPHCGGCPARSACVARRTGREELLPMFDKRAPTAKRRFQAFIVRREDRFLVRQRPAGVVNGLLWEFPNIEGHDAESGFESLGSAPLCRIAHSITRYRILLEAFPARLMGRRAPANTHWRTLAELEMLPLASAHRRILAHLRTEVSARQALADAR